MKKINEMRPVVQIESRPALLEEEKAISNVLAAEENPVDSLQPERSLKASARRYSLGLFPTKIGTALLSGLERVLSKGATQSLGSKLCQRTPIGSEGLGKLTPKSANMKRVHKSERGFMVAFPLHETRVWRERLQNEEDCLLKLGDSGLPVAQVYTTRDLKSQKALSGVEGRNALITDWVEGYEADIWKIRGQLGIAVKKFFHEVSEEHRQQRGKVLFESLKAIQEFFQSGNCIVDLQVVVESSTGRARIIDPAKVYKGNLPFKHRRRHLDILEELNASLTLVEIQLQGKQPEPSLVGKWSREVLESFWEIECDFDDLVFMEAIWNRLAKDPKRNEKFVEVMERARVVLAEDFEKFVQGRNELVP